MTTWSNVTSAYWWWHWYHIFQTGWNHQLESVFFVCVSVSEYFLWKIFFGQRNVVVRSVLGVLVDWWAWVSKTEKHRDVWCFCMKHLPNFVPKRCYDKSKRALPTNWRSSTVWRDVYQLRSSVHGCLKSWVPKGQRDNRVDQVERFVVKWMLLRYIEPNSHSVCSYDNPLEWWYLGMVIWPKLNVPRCIALDFCTNFAGRQRMKTDERSDGFECVEWASVMCWWRKSMTRGEENHIYIYMYMCVCVYIYMYIQIEANYLFLSAEIRYVSLWQTFRNSVMFKLL